VVPTLPGVASRGAWRTSTRRRRTKLCAAAALAAGAVADAVTTCLDAPAVYQSEANPFSRFWMDRIGAAPYMSLAALVLVTAAVWVATERPTPLPLLVVIYIFAALEPAVAVNNAAKVIRGTVLLSPTVCVQDTLELLSGWLLPTQVACRPTGLSRTLMHHVGWRLRSTVGVSGTARDAGPSLRSTLPTPDHLQGTR
jgi:hypothetical protein